MKQNCNFSLNSVVFSIKILVYPQIFKYSHYSSYWPSENVREWPKRHTTMKWWRSACVFGQNS